MFNAVLILRSCRFSVTEQPRDPSPQSHLFWKNKSTMERGRSVPRDVFTQPGVIIQPDCWLWVKWWEMGFWWRPCLERLGEFMSSSTPSPPPHLVPLSRVEVGEKLEEGKGWVEGEKWTNALDYNEEELSQEIAWPYINHAEAMGDLPAGPEHSRAPVGLPGESKSRNKTSDHDRIAPYSQGGLHISALTLSPTAILMVRDPWSSPWPLKRTPKPLTPNSALIFYCQF